MAETSHKSKRNVLSLGERLKLINHVQHIPDKKKKSLIAEEFKVPYTTLLNIVKNKEKYLSQAASGQTSTRKRARGPQLDSVDKALLDWFTSCRYDFIFYY